MSREQRPEQRAWHILHEGPDQVAHPVIGSKPRRSRAGAGATDMVDHGVADLQRAAADEAPAKCQVDVLDITEEPLVETAERGEPVAPVDRGRGTRREALEAR